MSTESPLVTAEPLTTPAIPATAPTSEEPQAEVSFPAPYENPFLESLTGSWVGKYKFGATEFDSSAEVHWAFNHQMVRGINISRAEVGVSESEEVWQPTPEPGVYRLWWFDSWGNAGLGLGRETAEGFIIQGDDPQFGSFRNTGTWNGPDELRFRLDSGPDENGEYTQVGGGFYRRVKA